MYCEWRMREFRERVERGIGYFGEKGLRELDEKYEVFGRVLGE